MTLPGPMLYRMSGSSLTAAAANVLFDALDEGVLVRSMEESTVTCNRAAERILGLTAGTVHGDTALDPEWRVTRVDGTEWPPEDYPIVRAIRDGQHTKGAIMHIDRDIGRCSISVNAHPIEEDGRIVGGVATFTDVTAEYLAADQASDNQRQLLDALHASDLAVATSDADGRVLTANPGFENLVGRAEPELIGMHFTEFSGPDSFDDTLEAVRLLRDGRADQFHTSKSYLQPDGSLRHALMNLLVLRDRVGAIERHVSIVQDVTEHVRNEQALEIEARTDPLTGLLNRRGLLASLDTALSAPTHPSMLVAFVDLDGFKSVNDRHGHEAGDRLLRSVAESMQDAVRASDVLGRLGGDEFVILFVGAPTSAAPRLARSVREAVESAVVSDVGDETVSASIGIVVPDTGESAADVLARADAAMYEVKRSGQRERAELWRTESRSTDGAGSRAVVD
jgi:diguanylate cyclase (GGDEF)-like protein/PAS domain S-box-containing protein